MKTLTRKLIRDLGRQRAQSLAIVVTIFLGTALSAASGDAFRNLEASYRRVFDETRFANLWVTGGDVNGVAQAARAAGAESTELRTRFDLPLRIGDRKLLGRVIGVPAGGAVNRLLSLDGARLDPARPDAALAESHLAAHFGLAPGARVEALGPSGWRPLEVIGRAASAEYLWPARSRQDVLPAPGEFGVLFVPEATARRLAGASGPNQALVRFKGGAPDPALAARLEPIAARLGATEILRRKDQASNATLESDIDGFRELALSFPLLFLTAAAIAAAVLLGRRVRSETTLIGTLRASGCSTGQIVRHYLGYGITLALAGAIPGALAGEWAAATVTRLYTSAIELPLTVVRAHPETMLLALGFGVLAGVCAGALPARAAARILPAQAMRGAAPIAGGGRSLLERVCPPVRRLPVRWRLVLRNLGRNRRRTFSTALGIVLAATLVLVSWGMVDTTTLLLHRQFDVIDTSDATVLFTGAPDAQARAALGRVPGVASVEPVAQLPVVLSAGDTRYATSLIAMPEQTRMHRFLTARGEVALPARGLLVGIALRNKLHLRRGETVHVAMAGFPAADVPIAGFVDEPLGTFAYASLDALTTRSGGMLGPTGAQVRFSPGADRAQVLDRLRALPIVAAAIDQQSLAAAARSYMGLFYAFVGAMLLFGGTLAFAILFITVSVGVLERAGEVATLRANGVDHATIARLLGAESLIVTVCGVLPGLAAGVLAARAFMAGYSNDLFRMDLHLRPSTPIAVALALILVSLLSEWPALRALRRLDLAKVARERSL